MTPVVGAEGLHCCSGPLRLGERGTHSVGPNPGNGGSAKHRSSPVGTEESSVPTEGDRVESNSYRVLSF